MKNKSERIALISIIIGIFLFFLPSEYLLSALFFLCSGIALAIIKKMWLVAGWASDKVEELK